MMIIKKKNNNNKQYCGAVKTKNKPISAYARLRTERYC